MVSSPNLPKHEICLTDDIGTNKGYLMNVGVHKGRIITGLVQEYRPKMVMELGSYIGYSAVLFDLAARENGDTNSSLQI
ncbi:hypothetical protein K504DRAFT_366731 [Pleomassaria siparia CBS 279.74]|uniref:S-adenosyl-L-methionine-dependent methyltransferase n=1 Tax=Pleomassaria siparia CBS 279.74 TaxID=1314801 RepID=A0A6G1KP11_9PLEO|nr:hypothetical protein K504DRAFT_366731 [Pleomassaria siparia CBS 279.74]